MNVSIRFLALSKVFESSPLLSSSNNKFVVSLGVFRNFFKPIFRHNGDLLVKRSYFNSFLDKTIVIGGNYYNYLLTNRKHYLIHVVISDTWFNSTASALKGSAIETNFYCFLVVKSCVFTNCYSVNEGGAIYHMGPECNISQCCFDYCTVSNALRDSNVGGNIFAITGNCNISLCHSTRSSPSIGSGGDTLYHLFNGLFHVRELNGTKNMAPNYGGIGGAFHKNSLGSSLSYSVFALSSDHNLFETWGSTSTVFKCNFINNTMSSNLMYSDSSTIYVKSCSFYGNTVKLPYGTLIISDSFSDFSISGASLIPYSLQQITGFQICKIEKTIETHFPEANLMFSAKLLGHFFLSAFVSY